MKKEVKALCDLKGNTKLPHIGKEIVSQKAKNLVEMEGDLVKMHEGKTTVSLKSKKTSSSVK